MYTLTTNHLVNPMGDGVHLGNVDDFCLIIGLSNGWGLKAYSRGPVCSK